MTDERISLFFFMAGVEFWPDFPYFLDS